jgi:peptidoglycan/LPS O-acetylase OafA/YrhL
VFYLLLAGLFSWGVHRRSGWYATAFAAGAVALGGVLPMAGIATWSSGPGAGPLVLNAVTDVLILAGLVLALSSRSRLVTGGTSLAALVALVLLTFNQQYPYPWSGCVILALMFSGTLIYRAEKGEVSRIAAAALVVLVLALATVAGVWHGARYGHHWEVQWATSVLLAGATFGAGLAVRRWRVPGWCAWLGVISYSVYLLHPLVFNVYRSIPVLHRRHTMPNQVLFLAGIVAVIIALSALTYYLVEKPMQRLGHRVAARFPHTSGTPSGDGSSALDDGSSARDDSAPDGGAAASRSASSSTAVAGGSGGSP